MQCQQNFLCNRALAIEKYNCSVFRELPLSLLESESLQRESWITWRILLSYGLATEVFRWVQFVLLLPHTLHRETKMKCVMQRLGTTWFCISGFSCGRLSGSLSLDWLPAKAEGALSLLWWLKMHQPLTSFSLPAEVVYQGVSTVISNSCLGARSEFSAGWGPVFLPIPWDAAVGFTKVLPLPSHPIHTIKFVHEPMSVEILHACTGGWVVWHVPEFQHSAQWPWTIRAWTHFAWKYFQYAWPLHFVFIVSDFPVRVMRKQCDGCG